ncbi:hypothetical protein KEU06_07885 [Pseudaminobacter sp. 19-2017]|uniref:Uncharacterized protein n=1 Tax=Pseudaminobacter soli (ex Zhang et al. 2022) TaxID=2831468 RepID=A0A942DX44_9HYPH|nr:hypothetical protein [Pseudaminobacter soli]MBS3648547.1 hypothetical protein [Pseudaminobacter soli]
MLANLADLREQLAVVSNDVEAIERILETLGYDGDLPTKTTRAPRIVLFYRGELRQFLRQSLEEHGPSTSRQLAERLVHMEGKDARDRRLMNDVVKRMGKALRQMREVGIVTRSPGKIKGEFTWAVQK